MKACSLAMQAEQKQPTQGAQAQPLPADARPPMFEVVTIKPAKGNAYRSISFMGDGLLITNMQLFPLLSVAYGHLQPNQIVGLPNWAKIKVFDIETKVAGSDVAQYRKLNFHQVELMLRPVLVL
jgi:uncharacterized protein (TIGR03435 family)